MALEAQSDRGVCLGLTMILCVLERLELRVIQRLMYVEAFGCEVTGMVEGSIVVTASCAWLGSQSMDSQSVAAFEVHVGGSGFDV